MTLYSIGIVAKHYGVSPSTIGRWVEKGLLAAASRTFDGHRRFDLQLNPVASAVERKHLGYARVSFHDQKEDLLRQAERLKQAGCSEVITDIDSSLNCNKPGLRALLNRILKGHVHTLSFVYEDRLLRFGTALIRLMCRKTGTDMRVLEEASPKTFEEELAKDVVTLMTVCASQRFEPNSQKGLVCPSQQARAALRAFSSRLPFRRLLHDA